MNVVNGASSKGGNIKCCGLMNRRKCCLLFRHSHQASNKTTQPIRPTKRPPSGLLNRSKKSNNNSNKTTRRSNPKEQDDFPPYRLTAFIFSFSFNLFQVRSPLLMEVRPLSLNLPKENTPPLPSVENSSALARFPFSRFPLSLLKV